MGENDRRRTRYDKDVISEKMDIDLHAGDYAAIQHLLWKWFFRESDKIFSKNNARIPANSTFLLGCPVWGTKYVNRFLFLTLPSLLAPGNLPRINGTKCHLVLYTDHANVAHLKKELEFLAHADVTYDIRLIPAAILARINDHPYNKFWILGTVQNLCIQYARWYGMAFHMLMPDHVYSVNYFTRLALLAPKHPIILQQSISADIDAAGPVIASCLNGRELALEGKGLADVAFYYLHQQIQPMLMNSRNVWDEISMSYYLLWVAEQSLQIYCPHVSLVFLSAEQVQARTESVLYNAIDTIIPCFLPKGIEPYFPTLEDDMVFVEMSDDTKKGYAYSIKFPEFCMRFWTVPHYQDETRYLDIFTHPSTLPVSENVVRHIMKREGREAMSESAIADQMGRILAALKNSRARIRNIKLEVDTEVFAEKAAA